MIIRKYKDKLPVVAESAFVAENVALTGDVVIGEKSSIWYEVVVRGDYNVIRIEKNTNVQDLTMVHADFHEETHIGDNVTIGHTCIIHGCIIEDNVLVGMGSTVMNGVKIGKNTIIGAGSLITEGKEIPSGVLAVGRPAKVVRELTEEEIAGIRQSAENYRGIADNYLIEE